MHNTTESKKDEIFIHINRMSFTFFSLISLLLKIICKTLSNSPSEVSGRKYLKLGLSEFLSLLNSLPLRKRCTLTTDFRNIGVKCWVLVLKTLGVSRYTQLSVGICRCETVILFFSISRIKRIIQMICPRSYYSSGRY